MEPDETLYRRVREGDLEAFDALYARYERPLFGFLLRTLRDRQDAEDVFHEAFLQVLHSREVRFDGGSFCSWLYRIARNLSLNHLRAGRREGARRQAAPPPPPPPDAEARLGAAQAGAALSRALEKLPAPLQELYHLRSAGLSYEEMAAVLGVPLGTVKSRMNQMVNQLRTEVSPWTA